MIVKSGSRIREPQSKGKAERKIATFKDGMTCVPVVAPTTGAAGHEEYAVLPVEWLHISTSIESGRPSWHWLDQDEIALWLQATFGREGTEDECIDQVVGEAYLRTTDSSEVTVSEIRERIVQKTVELAEFICDRQPRKRKDLQAR